MVMECKHEELVEVVSINGEVVAQLCLKCDEQLDPIWMPYAPGVLTGANLQCHMCRDFFPSLIESSRGNVCKTCHVLL